MAGREGHFQIDGLRYCMGTSWCSFWDGLDADDGSCTVLVIASVIDLMMTERSELVDDGD